MIFRVFGQILRVPSGTGWLTGVLRRRYVSDESKVMKVHGQVVTVLKAPDVRFRIARF